MSVFLLLILVGLGAGTLGGLLGIGGGILIMPMLRFVMKFEPAEAAGTCVVAVFCTTMGAGLKHHSMGHIHLKSIRAVIFAGCLSTFVFSMFFVVLSRKDLWLDRATGVVFFLVALRMLWEGMSDVLQKRAIQDSGPRIQGSALSKVTVGAAAGVLPGLLGIGTGAILVPAFAFALNAPIKTAIASSLVCFSLNALVSSAFKFSQGFVRLDAIIPLCAGTLIGSQFGAALNRRSPSPLLKALFGIVFVFVACKYMRVIGLG